MDLEQKIIAQEALLKELSAKRTVLEARIVDCNTLDAGTPRNLIDKEGYPLDNVDIPAIRANRHTLACLHTDLEAVNREIRTNITLLHDLYHQARVGEPGQEPIAGHCGGAGSDDEDECLDSECSDAGCGRVATDPFAFVRAVAPGSAAAAAGLREGDLILRFGSVAERNYTGKESLAHVVKLLRTIPVHIIRDKQFYELTVNIGEDGRLGAAIEPL